MVTRLYSASMRAWLLRRLLLLRCWGRHESFSLSLDPGPDPIQRSLFGCLSNGQTGSWLISARRCTCRTWCLTFRRLHESDVSPIRRTPKDEKALAILQEIVSEHVGGIARIPQGWWGASQPCQGGSAAGNRGGRGLNGWVAGDFRTSLWAAWRIDVVRTALPGAHALSSDTGLANAKLFARCHTGGHRRPHIAAGSSLSRGFTPPVTSPIL